jgi:hypothetical protein
MRAAFRLADPNQRVELAVPRCRNAATRKESAAEGGASRSSANLAGSPTHCQRSDLQTRTENDQTQPAILPARSSLGTSMQRASRMCISDRRRQVAQNWTLHTKTKRMRDRLAFQTAHAHLDREMGWCDSAASKCDAAQRRLYSSARSSACSGSELECGGLEEPSLVLPESVDGGDKRGNASLLAAKGGAPAVAVATRPAEEGRSAAVTSTTGPSLSELRECSRLLFSDAELVRWCCLLAGRPPPAKPPNERGSGSSRSLACSSVMLSSFLQKHKLRFCTRAAR